ncbi:MAG: FtsX-like permease family protein [Ruminococcus sp.]|nr:FtsX-like permease family protein [Ruminococcus sp.]
MLFKLSLNNIRRSIRDYAIYFFTLMIGVAVFYVFNAIETQTAFLEVSKDTSEMIDIMTKALSGVSVFVAVVLGLLIVYASRFLMKRRHKEFAVYLTLGMSKGRISAILLTETVIIGIGSLIAGLIIGIGLSQLLSAVVVDLFEANMTKFRFVLSGKSVLKTIIYFGIMYVVVMIFNSRSIGKCKLIDLIQSDKRGERLRLHNPWVCLVMFIISAGMLVWAYRRIGWQYSNLDGWGSVLVLAVIAAATFLFFWSVSGLLLRLAMAMKKTYFTKLNSFTYRQLSSKVTTMVFSMTVICLMLFSTVCLLSIAFSARKTLNNGVKEYFQSDAEIAFYNRTGEGAMSCEEVYAENGYDLSAAFKKAESVMIYDSGLKFRDVLGKYTDDFAKALGSNLITVFYFDNRPVYSVSDFNRMQEFRGRDDRKITLAEDEYAVFCNMKELMKYYDKALSDGNEITVAGRTLKPAFDKCKDDFVVGSIQRTENGSLIVPDSVAAELEGKYEIFWVWYDAATPKQKREKEEEFLAEYRKIFKDYDYMLREDLTDEEKQQIMNGEEEPDLYAGLLTKFQLADETVGIGAIATFIALYLGIVFLITCGAILALKQLSDSVDSVGRYSILRKIGADESDISASLFRQTGMLFLLPLLLAALHSFFALRCANKMLSIFIKEGFVSSMIFTSVIILAIYGGYFLITYLCSRTIIREKR